MKYVLIYYQCLCAMIKLSTCMYIYYRKQWLELKKEYLTLQKESMKELKESLKQLKHNKPEEQDQNEGLTIDQFYCKRDYFRWGEILQKCKTDITRGC